jgi:NAD(P)-dependent dehydrogenase (short-subunit alcohol dehydrogenase family)/acyl carrier protein
MLGPDLDVEADLSIDSIKRLEILSELADEIGLTDEGSLDAFEDLVAELAARKTLRGIVAFLHEHEDLLDTAPSSNGVAPAQPAAAAAGLSLPDPEVLLARLTAIVSVRTGYPEDMLGPDLDVEADLSIDSIKRLEILSELADEIGLTDEGSLDAFEDLVAELAARKTLRGIVAFLHEHEGLLNGAESATVVVDAAAAAVAAAPIGGEAQPVVASGIPPAANRFVVSLVEAPLGVRADLTDQVIHVSGNNPVAAGLVDEVRRRGATAYGAAEAPKGLGAGDLVVLADLFDSPDDAGARHEMTDLYARLRPLLLDTTAAITVVSPLGGGLGIEPAAVAPDDCTDLIDSLPVGAGVRGLVKTAALEFPERRLRLVDVDPTAPVDELARLVSDELFQPDAPVEVGLRGARRMVSRIGVRAVPDSVSDLPLTAESVVLLTGGARGITAQIAVALARRSGCRVELVGRSALPDGDETPEIAAAADRMALRATLVRAGWREPKAIEKECDRILSAREAGATLTALAEAGAAVTYHQVDVRDVDALRGVVASIYDRYGRLDGVVHGAGMLDDHFIVDKPPEAFERVFATKVVGARTLLGAIRHAVAKDGRERPAFVVFFGSTAGVCGNRGQADYAAANDALDTMAAANRDIADGVLAVDWGPWSSDHGMVSEALAAMFEEAGMGLIQIDDGTAVLLDEIAAAVVGGSPHQVTVARCTPDLMAAAFGQDPT